jgi:UDP-hydrolysing UDP-N-acetyl-D-glucosamine 2-epimerase
MRVAIVLTARASWAKLSTLCAALKAKPDVELQIIACASALLERYGRVVDVVKAEGFTIAEEIYSVIEGETLETASQETGALALLLTSHLRRLRPDMVVVCADRHEVLAAATAAAYLHIPLIHMQGGERSGSVDDKVRDAITQLADYHMVCTRRAQMRVYALTGDETRVIWTGCPSIDLAKQALAEPPVPAEEGGGAGAPIDLTQPFVVVLQHPVTSEAKQAGYQMSDTLWALGGVAQTLVFWPGQDAGAAHSSKVIRAWTSSFGFPLHTVRSLPPSRFLRLLTQCACLVGNSSAGIREASFLGVPVVNIGTRQQGRERGPNAIDVLDVGENNRNIYEAVKKQIAHGPYPSSRLYGSGNAGQRIAEVLVGQCTRHHSSAVRE